MVAGSWAVGFSGVLAYSGTEEYRCSNPGTEVQQSR